MNKMRLFLSAAVIALAFSTTAKEPISIKVSGMIFGTSQDSVYISQVINNQYVDYAGTTLASDGKFSFDIKMENADYYVIRFGQQHVNIILRDQCDIQVYGDGTKLTEYTNFVGSDESQDMRNYMVLVYNWQKKRDQALANIKANPEKEAEIDRQMKAEFSRFQSEQQGFIKQHPNSAALFPVLNDIDINRDFNSYESIVRQLKVAFAESPTVQKLEKIVEEKRKEIEANNPLAPGKEAPDFEEALADGSKMKLSDLRGKVVLLDFWASWCGPCRRENPNVVKLYEQYKDQGFTVMSVSLDKDKQRWLDAIEKDNLSWPNHVSDLKYWSSAAAKLYGVSGCLLYTSPSPRD